MLKFYTWTILLINQLDEIGEINFQFLAQEWTKTACKCTYPFQQKILTIALVIAKLKYLTFDPLRGVKGDG